MSGFDQHRFQSAGKALTQLQTDFNDWSSALTSYSIQVSFAIIAANWAVRGDALAILHNFWSKWSLVIVIVFLGINLLSTWLMTRLYYNQYLYAERDSKRWERECQESRNRLTRWPYTEHIENLGVLVRALKVVAPVTAGLFFVLSLFFGTIILPG